MDDARLFELLVDLHRDLPRLGPGDAANTRRALACCRALPSSPKVLDVGCGTGAPTLELAAATGGSVAAADLFPAFLVPSGPAPGREVCLT